MLFIGSAPYTTPINAYQSGVRTIERTQPIQKVFNNLLHTNLANAKPTVTTTHKLPEEPGQLIDIFG